MMMKYSKNLKYLSVCSGIEAATVAWHPLGWEPVAFSEIEKFPSQVLAHHYPNTPNLGDMTKFKEWNFGTNVDLFVGGTPCQSFSVAGLRKGLDDPRGNLMLTYLAIADKFRPRWLVWENVPGVLSSNGGKDFGTFLGGLGELGYGFAYRVLDAQYFGVAQRRRRVFVVGYLGDWRPAAAVLFERHSLSGNIAPRRKKREEVAGTITARFGISRNNHEECVTPATKGFYESGFAQYQQANVGGTIKASGGVLGGGSETFLTQPAYGIPGNWIGRKPENGGNATEPMHDIAPCLTKTDQHGVVQPIPFKETADCLTAAYGTKWNGNASADNGSLFVNQPVYEMHGQDSRVRELGDVCTTVSATYGTGGGNVPVTLQPTIVHGTQDPCVSEIAFAQGRNNGGENVLIEAIPIDSMNHVGRNDKHSFGDFQPGAPSYTLTKGHSHAVATHMAVRRLTPVECERLQGFSDNYTNIQPKGKPTPDGPRYKALGNSMAVPVMRWIGERIKQFEEME